MQWEKTKKGARGREGEIEMKNKNRVYEKGIKGNRSQKPEVRDQKRIAAIFSRIVVAGFSGTSVSSIEGIPYKAGGKMYRLVYDILILLR